MKAGAAVDSAVRTVASEEMMVGKQASADISAKDETIHVRP
jgi:hypothetical protein